MLDNRCLNAVSSIQISLATTHVLTLWYALTVNIFLNYRSQNDPSADETFRHHSTDSKTFLSVALVVVISLTPLYIPCASVAGSCALLFENP